MGACLRTSAAYPCFDGRREQIRIETCASHHRPARPAAAAEAEQQTRLIYMERCGRPIHARMWMNPACPENTSISRRRCRNRAMIWKMPAIAQHRHALAVFRQQRLRYPGVVSPVNRRGARSSSGVSVSSPLYLARSVMTSRSRTRQPAHLLQALDAFLRHHARGIPRRRNPRRMRST